jgi:hypothetical protein
LCGIGSGARDEDFQQAIKAGMIIVHVNSENVSSWGCRLENALQTHPQDRAL